MEKKNLQNLLDSFSLSLFFLLLNDQNEGDWANCYNEIHQIFHKKKGRKIDGQFRNNNSRDLMLLASSKTTVLSGLRGPWRVSGVLGHGFVSPDGVSDERESDGQQQLEAPILGAEAGMVLMGGQQRGVPGHTNDAGSLERIDLDLSGRPIRVLRSLILSPLLWRQITNMRPFVGIRHVLYFFCLFRAGLLTKKFNKSSSFFLGKQSLAPTDWRKLSDNRDVQIFRPIRVLAMRPVVVPHPFPRRSPDLHSVPIRREKVSNKRAFWEREFFAFFVFLNFFAFFVFLFEDECRLFFISRNQWW